MKEGYENKPCETCETPLYGGWVETPVYKGEYEKTVTMYIGYCTKCKKAANTILDVENV